MKKSIILTFLFGMMLGGMASAQTYNGATEDINALLNRMKAFSAAYVAGDYDKMAMAYMPDAHIFPNNAQIISGRDAIRDRWVLPEGAQILWHFLEPVEINVVDTTAYDFGYYYGRSVSTEGDTSDWKGKYVIVWKKWDEDWYMYLDIWNNVK